MTVSPACSTQPPFSETVTDTDLTEFSYPAPSSRSQPGVPWRSSGAGSWKSILPRFPRLSLPPPLPPPYPYLPRHPRPLISSLKEPRAESCALHFSRQSVQPTALRQPMPVLRVKVSVPAWGTRPEIGTFT
ncbi:hypothetical protein BaRGS_00017758, partial [Batillaria attramentaria]